MSAVCCIDIDKVSSSCGRGSSLQQQLPKFPKNPQHSKLKNFNRTTQSATEPAPPTESDMSKNVSSNADLPVYESSDPEDEDQAAIAMRPYAQDIW